MTKEEIKIIVKVLQDTNNQVDAMWIEKKDSPAYIVGYLQGSIKAIIQDLESRI